MPIPKYAAKRDKVEPDIIRQLRDIPGVSVVVISIKNVGDILVGREDTATGEKRTYLIEIKDKHGKLTDGQKQFREQWTGQHDVAYCVEDILRIIDF